MSTEFQPFALNFNNDKKVVSVTLTDEDGIFQLAQAFSDWLTQNHIKNTITETQLSTIQQINNAETNEDDYIETIAD